MPKRAKPLNSGICFDRVIPDDLQPARAIAQRDAVSKYVSAVRGRAAMSQEKLGKGATFRNHIQAMGTLPQLNAFDPVSTLRMALINQKKWENGYTLRCRFLDGDAFQQKKVQEKARIWCNYANIKITFGSDPDAEVRISFSADPGSWSAVGTDCLVTTYFPKFQPTMNFGWLRDDTADTEYERVVVHEFGHALGCIHEHQSPDENLQWNVDAVYKSFSGPPNFWKKADIDQNILQKYSPNGITASKFDEKSIMLYQFPASLFKNHKGTPLNQHLSDLDKQMIQEMYPK
jgi:hypothetical protein